MKGAIKQHTLENKRYINKEQEKRNLSQIQKLTERFKQDSDEEKKSEVNRNPP